jgi:hypothetical protein
MEKNLWAVLAMLGIAAAAGFGYLMSRPAQTPALATSDPGSSGATGRYRKSAGVAGNGSNPLAASLDAEIAKLKDQFFLLEVRHSTGDIAEDEYNRSRKALEERIKQLARR